MGLSPRSDAPSQQARVQTPASAAIHRVAKSEWTAAWVNEQRRRGDFERKLQSNEGWWGAALEVLGDGEAQNAALAKLLTLRLKHEAEAADALDGLGLKFATPPATKTPGRHPAALLATAAAASVDKADKERGKIAAAALEACGGQSLAPGRVLALLGADARLEALRKRRVAQLCQEQVRCRPALPLSS